MARDDQRHQLIRRILRTYFEALKLARFSSWIFEIDKFSWPYTMENTVTKKEKKWKIFGKIWLESNFRPVENDFTDYFPVLKLNYCHVFFYLNLLVEIQVKVNQISKVKLGNIQISEMIFKCNFYCSNRQVADDFINHFPTLRLNH